MRAPLFERRLISRRRLPRLRLNLRLVDMRHRALMHRAIHLVKIKLEIFLRLREILPELIQMIF